MNVKVFVDTNVLVYSRDISEVRKQAKAMQWMTRLWETRQGRLSFQVLQEFYVTVTEKFKPGLTPQDARKDVRLLLAWNPVSPDSRILDAAWLIQDRYRLSWWDALIVSSAQTADCSYLLSEDLQENQEFGSLKIINPFRVDPGLLEH